MSAKINQILYTICPVGNASFIAARKGWLKEGLAPLGIEPVLLQTLPQERWKAHFDQSETALFREGGNIPPIWAKSRGAEVILIGTALLAQKQFILVRADSPIESVDELVRYRLAIPVHTEALIDFHRASAEHGFAVALAARGFSLSQARLVRLETTGGFLSRPPNDDKANTGGKAPDWSLEAREFQALENGEADAVFVKLSTIQKVLDTGKFRVLFDLTANRNQLSPINNEYPEAFTVSRKLAEENPEAVAAFVKQVVRAAQWAKTHYDEALAWLAEQTRATRSQAAASFAFDFHQHLDLSLSAYNLGILEGQKRFLFDNGYLEKDFDLEQWADDRFLKAALAELEDENRLKLSA
jgi:2'-hydroxybiphenyl-2-sulfinate desulfinase